VFVHVVRTRELQIAIDTRKATLLVVHSTYVSEQVAARAEFLVAPNAFVRSQLQMNCFVVSLQSRRIGVSLDCDGWSRLLFSSFACTTHLKTNGALRSHFSCFRIACSRSML
jgi:hypothetical protein